MFKAVDDANGCVKSRLIVGLSSSTDGVTRVAVLWHNISKVVFQSGKVIVVRWLLLKLLGECYACDGCS